MKQLVIDRFEGKYAICEDSDQKYFAIELSELPKEAKPGCVLQITDEGELRQVLINLINNSVKAMPDGGELASGHGRRRTASPCRWWTPEWA